MALKIVVLLKILQMVFTESIPEYDCHKAKGILTPNGCVIFSEPEDKCLWEDALEKCWQKYGPLASPAYPEYLQEIAHAFHPGVPFWVAGYSLPHENTFRWINGTQIPESGFPWAHGEPTPPEQPSDQRCMMVNYDDEGYGNEACSNYHRYVCILDACGVLGGVTLGSQCLKFMENLTSWDDAYWQCKSERGELAIPAYPQSLLNYIQDNFNESGHFWVGGLQTDSSDIDSWYWLNGQHIPHGDKQILWCSEQHSSEQSSSEQTSSEQTSTEQSSSRGKCLDTRDIYDQTESGPRRCYNDVNGYCTTEKRFICELDTSMSPPPQEVQFTILQMSSEKYIRPDNFFPHIKNGDYLTLHFGVDRNLHMAFDIVDGIWGHIRHVISGKILTPISDAMNPADGTKVVLQSDPRPWALFALDQYQNRIIHRSGKFVSSDGKYVTITGDETMNNTMGFQFMNITNPNKEVLPYGFPVISGDWELVFSVLNAESTKTYSSKVTIGRSETHSTSYDFKFGFEVARNNRSSILISSCSSWPWNRHCISSSSSSDISTTYSVLDEMEQASSETWNSESTQDISFTVGPTEAVAVWQRIFILEHKDHRTVYLSNMFADTASSRLNPDNFGTLRRHFPFIPTKSPSNGRIFPFISKQSPSNAL